jgi:putative ferrous iron transport protein C
MSLLDIRQYLMQVRITSLSGICVYFNAEPEALRGMMAHWIRKGCVRQCAKNPSCASSCGKCSPALTEIYEWVA